MYSLAVDFESHDHSGSNLVFRTQHSTKQTIHVLVKLILLREETVKKINKSNTHRMAHSAL